jgi:thiosulfate/3-mercaptopyruvate sulfurtransferase
MVTAACFRRSGDTTAMPDRTTAPGPLVSTAWVEERLATEDVRVLDCRWYLRPFDERNGIDEYRSGHVPGAVHVRWDTALADLARPHSMVAGPERFAAAMGALGVGDDTFVVTYDDHHVPVAARVWWALRLYGHDRVAVMDGGITRWRAEGRPLETAVPAVRRATFTARHRSELYATKDDVMAAVAAGDVRLFDARMDSAYDAATGHIPGAVRLVGLSFLGDGERWISPDAARERIAAAGGADGTPVIAYCGGGVAATGLALAFRLAGLGDVAVYDGSWTEWEADPATPKVLHGT